MYKKFIPILLICILSIIIALIGYNKPKPKEKIPTRILFNNSGGKVYFAHLKHHQQYQISCNKCHHEQEDDSSEPLPCASCHPQRFNKDYIRSHIESFPDTSYCSKCHHAELGELNFNHDEHIDYADNDCQACHHDEEIEDEPQNCTNCHKNMGTKDMPSIRDAAHDRCITCHEDLFNDGLAGCDPCHKMKDMTEYEGDPTPCAQCHDQKTKHLVLDRKNAFHDQCMSCHKELKKGPYKQDDCNKCHLK